MLPSNGKVQRGRHRLIGTTFEPIVTLKNARSCGREAASAGTACSASGIRRLGCKWHVPTTPAYDHACTTSVRLVSRASGITRCTTGLSLNHAHLESRFTE